MANYTVQIIEECINYSVSIEDCGVSYLTEILTDEEITFSIEGYCCSENFGNPQQPAVNQNNFVKRKYLGIYGGDEGFSFDDLFMNNTLTVEEDENWLLYVIEKIDGSVPDLESPENSVLDVTKFVLKKYLFGPGKGTYSPIPNVLDQDIFLVEATYPTIEDMIAIFQGANTQTFELGDISADIETHGSYWEAINNLGPFDMTDPDLEYFFLFTANEITYLYLFVGSNGLYGLGEQQSVENDYLLITSSDVEVNAIIPSWQQTIDVNRNADRATLYHVAYNGGLFGGYVGATPTVIVQDPVTNRIYYFGYFITYQGIVRNHIIATLPDGTIDDTYNVGTGFNSFPFTPTKIAMQPDGKIIYAGNFTQYRGVSANRIVRVNTDGTIDNTFVYGTGFNNFTTAAVLDSTGKIYVGGIFGTYNGITGTNRIVRLNTDGTRDFTFDQGTGLNNTVTDITVDSNDDIYVVGYFASYKGVTGNNRIIKILSNGDKDTTFNTGTGFNTGNHQPLRVYLTSDNKVFVIGHFTLYNGTTVNKMVKLNLDGTIDTSFNSQGTGFNGTNLNQFFEYQGGYLLSGDFTSYNGVPSNNTILLDTAGNIIRTFPLNTQVRQILNDGRIIAIEWTGSAYNIGVLEDNYVVNLKRFNYDETNGKATYEIGGLLSTTDEEILPKRLIQELVNLSILNTNPSLIGAEQKREVKTIEGTIYTLQEEDKNKILHFTSNSDVTITIPAGLTSTNRYEGKQLGTGQLLFGADIGVTLRVGASELAKTAEQYSVFGLDVIGAEEYMLYGKLELS